MDVDLYKWTTNMIAYLYKHYERTELVIDLPTRMEYQISKSFNRRVGDCQIHVNGILRPKLQSIFQKNYLVACRSVSTFRACIERGCLKLFKDFNLQIYYLCFFAIVSELNLYCFQQGCYRYALYVPQCLENLLQITVLQAISAEEGQSASISERFDKFLKCCEDILEPSAVASQSNYQEIVNFGETFVQNEMYRFKRKNRLFKLPLGKVQEESDSSKVSEEECSDYDAKSDESSADEAKCEGSSPKEDPFAEEDSDANLLAAAKPFNSNACSVCHEENCKRYLEEFVRQFAAGEMKYAPIAAP